MSKIAIVHDALAVRGGAEKVLETVCELFPDAPIYTLVYDENLFKSSEIAKHSIQTSFIQKLPFSKRLYRNYLPLLPLAIEQFDLSNFSLVISLSYAVAHGILTNPDQMHINYCFAPLRHAWHNYHNFISQQRGLGKLFSPLLQGVLSAVRLWDYQAAQRVDHFLAVSKWIQQLVRKYYQRESTLLYPPLDVIPSTSPQAREDFFLVVSRLAPHKQLSLVVKAFNKLGLPLKIVGIGRELPRLKRMATKNIEFVGYLPNDNVQDLMSKARAFIVAGTDDFNIAAVEAQACGCPVIAYGRGGVCETVIEGETGIFYHQPTISSLVAAVERFIEIESQFSHELITKNAIRFSKPIFQENLLAFIRSNKKPYTPK